MGQGEGTVDPEENEKFNEVDLMSDFELYRKNTVAYCISCIMNFVVAVFNSDWFKYFDNEEFRWLYLQVY